MIEESGCHSLIWLTDSRHIYVIWFFFLTNLLFQMTELLPQSVWSTAPLLKKNRPLGAPQHYGLPLKCNGKKCPSPKKSIHNPLCLCLFVWSSAFQPDTFHSKIVFISFLNSAAAFTVLCPSCLQPVLPFLV